MYEIAVSEKFLNSHRMLMDWQLRELGIDPAAFTEACRQLDLDHFQSWLEARQHQEDLTSLADCV